MTAGAWPVRRRLAQQLGRATATLQVVVGACLVAAIAAGCGKPEPSPERIIVPQVVAIIEEFELSNEVFTYRLESGQTIEVDRERVTDLGGTGTGPGDLFLYADGDRQWIATLASVGPDDPRAGSAWYALAPAWLGDSDVTFVSGLQLPLSPDFAVDPAYRPIPEGGYVIVASILIDEQGRVITIAP